MKTIKDYVNFYEKPAYLFKNNFNNKYQYFIPLIDNCQVIIDDSFNELYNAIVVENKIVLHLKNLLNTTFLSSDDRLFIVPLYFDEKPEEEVINFEEVDENNDELA